MALTISTINVNGVRAAVRERSETNLGLLAWLRETSSDVVCLQETRATHAQVHAALAPAVVDGWHVALAESETAGRNGVAVLSRRRPDAVRVGFGDDEFRDAGRYLEADFGALTVASLYLPSGNVGTPKQDEKDRFLKVFGDYLAGLGRAERDVVVCGDWNIAHTERDLKNHKGNKNNSGFLPYEREWLGALTGDGGAWIDVARRLHPDVDGPYTWWSWRGKAFDNDSGWRIDLQYATASLGARAVSAHVERPPAYDLRWSDHSPLTVVYDD